MTVSSCNAEGKGLREGIMNHHETKRQKVERLDQQLRRRYRKLAKFPFPLFSTASLRVIGEECHTPLLVEISFRVENGGKVESQ